MKNLSLTTLILLFFASCAQEQKSNVKFSFSSAAVGGNTSFTGGLLLLGKSANGSIVQKIPQIDDTLDLELPNGDWGFTVIGWNGGGGTFEGNTYCDFKPSVRLSGSDVALTFDAARNNCAAPALGGNIVIENGGSTVNFTPLKIHTCLDIKKHLQNEGGNSAIPDGLVCDGGSNFEKLPGEFRSFRVRIPNYRRVSGVDIASGLASGCKAIPAGNTNYFADTQIRLPIGTDAIKVPYFIEAFTGQNCDGATKTYSFDQSFQRVAQNFEGGVKNLNNPALGPPSLNVYLHSDTCSPAMLTRSPFATSANGTHLICTADQLLQVATNPSDNFILGKSIDLSSVTTAPNSSNVLIENFSGKFDGSHHTLTGSAFTLFDNIEHNLSPGEVEIYDLTLESFSVSNINPSSDSFGVFANKLIGTSSALGDLRIKNITINNSTITLPPAGSTVSNLGILFGKIRNESIDLHAIIEDNKVYSSTISNQTISNPVAIGTMAGRSEGIAPAKFMLFGNKVGHIDQNNRNGFVTITSDPTNSLSFAGGFFGYAEGVEILSENSVVANITNNSDTGGIIGKWFGDNTIRNTRVDLNYIPSTNCAPCNNLGGLIGSINNNAVYGRIENVISKLVATGLDEGTAINEIGGAVGYFSTGSPSSVIPISNSKFISNIQVNGNSHGGVYGMSNFAEETQIKIANTYVNASLNSFSTIAQLSTNQNSKKGLISGNARNVVVARSIFKGEISGTGFLGGAFGALGIAGGVVDDDNSRINETYIDSMITSTISNNSILRIGGVIGMIYDLRDGDSQKLINNSIIKSDIDLVHKTAAPSQDRYISYSFGHSDNTTLNGELYYKSIISTDLSYQGSPFGDDTWFCSNVVTVGDPCSVITYAPAAADEVFSTTNSTACTNLIGASAPFKYNSNQAECNLLFEYQWQRMGGIYDGSNIIDYKAGSPLEPFEISTPEDWNSVSDDAFLLTKSFRLTQDIDFIGRTDFVPFGASSTSNNTNPFTGSIESGPFSLINVDYTPAFNHPQSGIFAHIDMDAQIGSEGAPFNINNTEINCQLGNCGLVGLIEGGRVHLNASNININGNSGSGLSCLGGIAGTVSTNSYVEIRDSRFQGSINAPVFSDVGTIGCISGATSSHINIYGLAVELNTLIGQTTPGGNIGGLVGNYTNSMANFYFEESYIKFASGINFSPYHNGLFGHIFASSNINLVRSFLDYSQTTYASGFGPFAQDNSFIGADPVDFRIITPPTPAPVTGLAPSTYTEYSDLQNLLNDTSGGDFREFIQAINNQLQLEWEFDGIN